MQSEQLIKVAHQLIATANELIQAAKSSQAVEIMVQRHGAIGEVMHEEDKNFFQQADNTARPSKHSQFKNNEDKIFYLKAEIKECETNLDGAKNENTRGIYRRKLGILKGHLTKATTKSSGTKWKSQV